MKALRICGAVFAAFLIILAFALSAFADDVGIVSKDDVKRFVKKLDYSPFAGRDFPIDIHVPDLPRRFTGLGSDELVDLKDFTIDPKDLAIGGHSHEDIALKVFTIVIGLIVIITLGFGLLSPGRMKKLLAEFASRKPLIRVVGIFILVVSLLIFLVLGTDWKGARQVMAILGVLFLLGGLFLAFCDNAELLLWFAKLSKPMIRILSAVGVAVGAAIIVLGIVYY